MIEKPNIYYTHLNIKSKPLRLFKHICMYVYIINLHSQLIDYCMTFYKYKIVNAFTITNVAPAMHLL